MGGFQTFWNGLDWSILSNMLLSAVPALLCITLHELAHGYVAWRLGDDTAKNAGRLTLNPIRHIDPLGLLLLVTVHFGWAKPVPVNMNRFENPKAGMAVTAAAGPLCNLLLAAVLLFVYGLVYSPLTAAGSFAARTALNLLSTTVVLSLSLAVFNILPISPLDGSKVLFAFLNDRQYAWLMRYERYGMLALMVLMYSGILRTPLSQVTDWLLDRLMFLAQWGFELAGLLGG